jgi:hypothetical protein
MSEPQGDGVEIVTVSQEVAVSFPDFRRWLTTKGVSEGTADTLIDSGFSTKLALSVMFEEDLGDMGIAPKAQYRLVQAAVKSAKASIPRDDEEGEVPVPPTPRATSPVRQPAIQGGALLDSLLRDLPLPATVEAPAPSLPRGDLDPTIHLSAATLLQGKALQITDFVNIAGSMESSVEHVVSDAGGGSLILKSGPKKPKLENVSVWQWCLGAIRILDHLERSGKLPGEELRHYYAYCCKILEFNGRYDWQHILLYDRDYRVYQATYNFPWGTDISHLKLIYLREKSRAPSQSYNQNQRRSTNTRQGTKAPSGPQSQDFCRLHNNSSCSFNPCKFLHACSVPGCKQSHKAINHEGKTSLNA